MIDATRLTQHWQKASWAGARVKPGKAAWKRLLVGTSSMLIGLRAHAVALIAISMRDSMERRSALVEGAGCRSRGYGGPGCQRTLQVARRRSACLRSQESGYQRRAVGQARADKRYARCSH